MATTDEERQEHLAKVLELLAERDRLIAESQQTQSEIDALTEA